VKKQELDGGCGNTKKQEKKMQKLEFKKWQEDFYLLIINKQVVCT